MAVSDRIAVMNEGSIVQTGSAQDLYHRPSSRFVAQFIGRANLVPGRVEVDGVQALGRTFPIRATPPGVRAGDAVSLLVRPEAIALARPAGGAGEVAATVSGRAFLGEKIEYMLDCNGTSLQVARYNAGPQDLFDEGARVALRFVDDAVVVLAEGVRG